MTTRTSLLSSSHAGLPNSGAKRLTPSISMTTKTQKLRHRWQREAFGAKKISPMEPTDT